MLRIFALLLALLCVVGIASAATVQPTDFWVATNGNDNWSGQLAAPNARHNDGPFFTIQRAVEAVRDLKASQPGRTVPIIVTIRSGNYFLTDPIVFTPADSGTTSAPVIYQAQNNPPLISGGVQLSGFKKQADGKWQLKLPDVAAGRWTFTQLFVNGQRRYRPRLPKDGYYYIDGQLDPSPASTGLGFDRFQFKPGEISSAWHNLGDVEILPFHYWTMDRFRIGSVDDANRAVTFSGHTAWVAGYFDLAAGRRYIVENVREALTRPGEWYLDNPTGVLTYIPMPGESPSNAAVFAPRVTTLVQFNGNAAAGQWVQNIQFKNLTFAHCNWLTPAQGYACGQAEVNIGGALSATGLRSCSFTGCVVKQCGTYAFDLAGGSNHNTIEDCDMTDLGAGGVKIGDQGIPADTSLTTGFNTVRNCSITHCGRMHPAAIGVWIGQSSHNTISHNEIWDLYYSGLSLGWTWGYGPAYGNYNDIDHNNVHLIGQNVLSDMGGIYTLGDQTGTTIHYNRFYDCSMYYYGSWGIYFDEGTSNITAENNLIYNTAQGNFHQHYGQNNTFRNNILAGDSYWQIQRTRNEDHLSFNFTHNIVYYKTGRLLYGDWTWTGGNYALDYNCYWDGAGGPTWFWDLPLDQWRSQRGQDVHSVIADPLFVDPVNRNYTLQAGSPALGVGFVPFSLSTTGRTTPTHDPITKASVPRAYPGLPAAQPIVDTFESTAVGQPPAGAALSEENTTAVIRVSADTAAGGTHSLKFTDMAGLTYPYNPHMWYVPEIGLSQGLVEGSFDLRLGPGAYFFHEWRDWFASPYYTGPSMEVFTNGWLYANWGTAICQVPTDTWIHIDITANTGDTANGQWGLTVTWPGLATPYHVEGLPCDSRFRTMNWYGFVSNTDGPSVFYIDNVNLRRVGP